MKMNHAWSVLCRESIIDQETNNISIIDVFERLDVDVKVEKGKEQPTEINVPINYEMVSMWTRDAAEGIEKLEVELEIMSPDNTSLKSFFNQLEVPAGLLRMRTRIKVSGLALKKPGIYKFVIKSKHGQNYEEVARIPLEIRIKTQEKNIKKKDKVVN